MSLKTTKSDLYVLLIFTIFVYVLFRYAGSFNKGYDLIEDQAILNTYYSVDSNNVLTSFKELMRVEVLGLKRFRPCYIMYIMSVTKVFGTNILHINIFTSLVFILTLFFLYKFCTTIGFRKWQSVIFSLLTCIGPPTIMWIRPVDAEIPGMLFYSIALYMMSLAIFEKRIILYQSLFLLFILIASLCKESFMIVIPATVFLYFGIYHVHKKTTLFETLKQNKYILIGSVIVCVAVMLSILKLIGTDPDQSYSGVDVNLLSGKVYLDFLSSMFKIYMLIAFFIGLFFVIDHFLSDLKNTKTKLKNFLKSILYIFLFFLMVIIPQLIIYYKTGFIGGRYYLPYLFGFAFILTYLIKIIFDNSKISKFVKLLFLALVIGLFLDQTIKDTIPSLVKFSDECRSNTDMVYEISKQPESQLLIVMDPVQNYYKIYPYQVFLKHLNTRTDFKFHFEKFDFIGGIFKDSSFYNNAKKLSDTTYGKRQIDVNADNKDIQYIMVFNGLNKKFTEINSKWFRPSDFIAKQYSQHILYMRKK